MKAQNFKWHPDFDQSAYVEQWDRSYDDLERHLQNLVKNGHYIYCVSVFRLPEFSQNYFDNFCVQQRISRATWKAMSLSDQQELFDNALLELLDNYVSAEAWQACSPDQKLLLFHDYLLSLSNKAVVNTADTPGMMLKRDSNKPFKPTVNVDDLHAMNQFHLSYFWQLNGVQIYNSANNVLRKHILDSLVGPMLFDERSMGETDYKLFSRFACKKRAFQDVRNDQLVRHIVTNYQQQHCRADTREEIKSARTMWYMLTPVQRYMWLETVKEYHFGTLTVTPFSWRE